MSTPFLDEVYTRVDFDRDLVFKFFTVFSLFEYALKQAGFRTTRGDAKPDWVAFARNIQGRFDANVNQETKSAYDYLLNFPVMRQVVHNNALVFIDRQRTKNQTDLVWLSLLLRGVRNNLFHGGKYRYERPRDPELIQHSLVILEAWARCNNDVEHALRTV